MTRKILPLVGIEALYAFNAYSALILGLNMLPGNLHKDRLEFLREMQDLPPERQESWLREAVAFVRLSPEEIGAMISFATDPNGVRYRATNKDNLTLEEIHEICSLVAFEISKCKIRLVSEDEQKKNPRRFDRPEADVPAVSRQDP